MGRLRAWLAPAVPPGFEAARPSSSAFFWTYGIIGAVLTIVMIGLELLLRDPLFWILPALAALVTAYYLVNATQRRLEFGPAGFRQRVGPYARFVAAGDLVAVEPGRAAHSEWVVLRGASGERLRLVMGSAYERQAEWAPLVLAAARAKKLKLDPKARKLLTQ